MDKLSGSQKRWLRGRAHGLKPVVRLGKQGLTEGALAEVDSALGAHELIKIHCAGTREEKAEAGERITAALSATAVGQIGNVLILYREQPDPEKRTIHLPR